ncbi:unnamed protein product [Phytomonas sp. EM1]|nr:unnamed protein product [Phytomonas sp. EM1]|eukprot:CCW62542.1 unnamed protein product [Phytomonas sp. isolate EM1]
MSQPPVPSSSNASGGQTAARRGTHAGKKRSIIFTRPRDQAWTCPHCSKTSVDIRRMCGSCLSPEPNTDTAASASDFQQQCRLDLEPPESTNDPGVRLYKMPNTHRVYRQFVEPLGIDGSRKANYSADPRPGTEEEDGSMKINAAACGTTLIDDPSDDLDEPLEESVLPEKRDTATSSTQKTSQPHQLSTKSSQYTHFISLPIGKLPAVRPLAEAFLKNLCDFLEQRCGVDGASNSNKPTMNKQKGGGRFPVRYPTPEDVTKVDKLHITLLMLSLHNEKDVEFAKTLLHAFEERWNSLLNSESEREVKNNSGKAAGVRVTLGGLRVMPNRGKKVPDPRQSGVIYMELHNTDVLRRLQDLLFDTFAELIDNQDEANHSKLLHLTIINKKWSSDPKSRLFDATEVLKCFGNATILGVQKNQDGTYRHDVWVDRLELNRRFIAGGSANEYQVEDAVML